MADSQKFSQWRPHPWHGLAVGPNPPFIVHAYIEITPFDSVKYEVDKLTGYLRVDRPQRTSSQPPMLYGFIPRTYCGVRVGRLSPKSKGGDHDPLDICVISERPVAHPEVILNARVVGGIQLIDNGLADDKIIGVLANDTVWDKVEDISELPEILVERMKHYFSTYKIAPGKESEIWIEELYGKEPALRAVKAAMEDYDDLVMTKVHCP
ncbi:MAG TPA: inorganic pyrophosphatase [Desulfomonilia bacterium]|nr:inorganic pyrophosphatase [Desulfomonilia bacterium]